MYAEYIACIDPKEGFYADSYNINIRNITRRARKILTHRTREEIYKAAKILDEIAHMDSDEDQLEELIYLAKREEAGEEIEVPTTPAKILAYYIEKTGLTENPEFPNAKPEEYFAALALASVGKAHQRVLDDKESNTDTFEGGIYFSVGHCAVEAMEAVAFAESLIMSKRAEKAAIEREKKKRSSVAKRAGEARHEDTKKLLKRLHKFYIENGYTQYSKAVEDFLKEAPEELYRHLAPTNRERTLREGLSRIIRGKLVL